MANTQTLQPVTERGWRQGLANLMRKENDQWWRTRRWWVQSLLWLLVIYGTLAVGLWLVPVVEPPSCWPRYAQADRADAVDQRWLGCAVCRQIVQARHLGLPGRGLEV